MATENLQIRITAELSQIRASLQGLTTQLEQTRKSGDKIGTSTAEGVGKLNQKLSGTVRIVAGLAAAVGASLSIAGLIKASDEAGFIAARLRLATKSAQELAIAQRGVYEIAQRTRTAIGVAADLYSRIERSTRQIGLNQATVLQLTETIAKTSALSGGGAGVEAALVQFGQLLAAGDLSAAAQELGSIQEQAPRLAQAMVEGLKELGYEGTGSLKKLVSEGGVPLNDLLKALLTQVGAIDDEFKELPPSISGGFTQIRNAFINFLANSKEAQDAARAIGAGLKTVADNLPAIISGLIMLGKVAAAAWVAMNARAALLAVYLALQRVYAMVVLNTGGFVTLRLAAIGSLGAIRIAAGALFAVFAGWQLGSYLQKEFLQVRLFGLAMVSALVKGGITLRGAFVQTGVVLRETFITAFNYILDKAAGFYAAMGRAVAKIPGVGGKASSYFNDLAAGLTANKLQAEGIAKAYQRVADEANAAKAAVDANIDGMVDFEIAAELAKGKAAAQGAVGDVGIPDGVDTPDKDAAGKAAKAAAKLAQINADLIKDSVTRAMQQLDRLYEAGKISIADYYAEKQRLELEGIDASVRAAEAELAASASAGESAAAQAEIVKLLRDRKQVAVDAIEAQGKAEDELTRKLGAVHIRLMQANGDTGRAARAELEDEFRELIVRLQREGDKGGEALVRKLINVETFDAQLSEIEQKVSEALGRMSAVEAATGAQVEAGMLGQSDGETRVKEQREASLAVLLSQREALVAVYDAAELAGEALIMDEASASIAQLDGQIAQLSINTESLGYKAAQVLKGALSTLFTDLASGSKSAGDALKDFVRNFVTGMAQIAANALATFLVLQLLDAIYPGLGKMTAAVSGATSAHSGGMAGESGTRRYLPSMVFAGAPRYHSGGVAGLSQDEIPAVLQKGEEVLTKGDPRHRNNGGMGGDREDPGTRFVFVDDQRDVGNYLESAAGERVVVKILERNKMSL